MNQVVAHAEVLDSSPLLKIRDLLLSTGSVKSPSVWEAPLRTQALKAMEACPFPTPTHELWRQTSPALFPWERLAEVSPSSFELYDVVTGEVCSFPGVELLAVTDPAVSKEVAALLEQDAKSCPLDACGALRRMFLGQAQVVKIAKGVVVEHTIGVRVKGGGAVIAPWLIVLAAASSKARISINVDRALTQFDFSTVIASLAANAELGFTWIQSLSSGAVTYQLHRFYQARDSRVRSWHAAVGARACRVDLDAVLYESGAHAMLSQAYLADGKRHVDFHPNQIHLAPHCGSDLFCKGVAKDRAHSVYYGYIKVAEGAQKTDAYQKNRNLLFSSEARADAIPNLEIKANDVKCSHGASVSQIGGDELFYLMSRGLDRKAAETLLVEAFFTDLLEREADPALREQLSNLLLSHLLNKEVKNAPSNC